jgi:hypothetical protein
MIDKETNTGNILLGFVILSHEKIETCIISLFFHQKDLITIHKRINSYFT